MKRFLLLTLIIAGLCGRATQAVPPSAWQTLAPGMELRVITARTPSPVGDSRITVLRIDPLLWDLVFAGISQTGESDGLTARQWCERRRLTAAINAGMFDMDYRTHTGYLRSLDHINSPRMRPYQSVAAFGPRAGKSLPRFRIFDLDSGGVSLGSIQKDYELVVQNLRLIKRPGINQWGRQEKKWSEAALGEDREGRILFIYSRSPFSMHDFNEELLASDIGIVAAQHLEGGSQAQMYLRAGRTEMELLGGYQSSSHAESAGSTAWPVPNVLGIRPRLEPHP